MKLRSRLGLTLALLVVPFAAGVAYYQVGAQRSAFEQGTAEAVVERMQSGERAVCEEAPAVWPRMGPPRGPRGWRGRGRRSRRPPPDLRVWAYDVGYASANPNAPAFPAGLRDALERGEGVASVAAGGPGRFVAVRMPWDEGPCAIVLVRRPGPPEGGAFGRALVPSLVVSAAAVLLAVLAAGPIVRRIRRLTDAVRRPPGDAAPIDVGGRDEVAELARAFEESRSRIREQIDELERRDETLRSYLTNTTHDVMIPVTVLQGHLSAIERSVESGKPVEVSRVRDALEECHYLASLVHNLNAAARLEVTAGEPRRDPVDLGAVVERVIGRHGPFARQREVELNFAVPEGSTVTLGDMTLVERAVGNLVHNAVRYNRPGGHVAVVLERDGARFHLRVVDDGPGIPAEELVRVAERGFRGDRARSRHPHGLGLGLHIVRDVAERHGFELRFESPGEGGLEVHLSGDLAGEPSGA